LLLKQHVSENSKAFFLLGSKIFATEVTPDHGLLQKKKKKKEKKVVW